MSIKHNSLSRIDHATKAPLYLKYLLNRFHPGMHPAFFKSLPQDEVKEVFKQANVFSRYSQSLLLAPRPISQHPLFLACSAIDATITQKAADRPWSLLFTRTNPQRLKKLLKSTPSLQLPADSNCQKFLARPFYQQWQPKEPLPPPISSLIPL